jgi:hypothetical protein
LYARRLWERRCDKEGGDDDDGGRGGAGGVERVHRGAVVRPKLSVGDVLWTGSRMQRRVELARLAAYGGGLFHRYVGFHFQSGNLAMWDKVVSEVVAVCFDFLPRGIWENIPLVPERQLD